jgi:hypothetical protein
MASLLPLLKIMIVLFILGGVLALVVGAIMAVRGLRNMNRGSNWGLWTGVAGLVAGVIFCSCGLTSALMSDALGGGQTKTATPRTIKRYTATPIVELSPTKMPVPTPTISKPTPASTPASDQKKAYLLKAQPHIEIIGSSLDTITSLLRSPMLESDTWKASVQLQIVLMQQAHKDLTELTPPPEMADYHAALLAATGDCNTSMDYLGRALKTPNETDINTANTFLASCGEKASKAVDLLEKK